MRYRFMRFPNGKTKALTLSYDDGVSADKKLVNILNNYGIKCTFNINDSFINTERHLSEAEIKEYILDNGHELANHGKSHIAPGVASAKDGIRDIFEGRRGLENRFSKIIKGMAYPDSGVRNTLVTDYDNVKVYLQMLEIAYSRTLGGDNNGFRMPGDWHKWMPTCHHNHPNLLQWLEEFKKMDVESYYPASRESRLFYLWGHSYEFDNDNNWDVIEEFCKCAADSDDIWFATNIEIYEYAKAYEMLEFSIDNNLVYNPSLQDVYFCTDGINYVVKSGETICLKEKQ